MSLLGIEKDVNLSGDVYGKLENGDIVASDLFEIGHVMFQIDESGSKKKVKDGEYKLFTPGGAVDGPVAYMVYVKDSVIETLDEIREADDAKKQPSLSKTNGLAPTNLSKNTDMENKMNMQEVEKLQEPLKDLPASDKDAMKAEIEDIKKSLASLQEALASLLKEKEAEMASQKDEGKNNEKAAVIKEEEMYSYGKNNEAAQAKKLEEKGSQNQNLSAVKKQLFQGAPVEPNANLNVKVALNNQSVETSLDRVFKRLAQ